MVSGRDLFPCDELEPSSAAEHEPARLLTPPSDERGLDDALSTAKEVTFFVCLIAPIDELLENIPGPQILVGACIFYCSIVEQRTIYNRQK